MKAEEKTNKRLVLTPLNFDEAVTDLLKVKPPPKEKKAKANQSAKTQKEAGRRKT